MKTFLRRLLFVFLGLIGLVALFYAEEDLRGWLAWKNCTHTFEAKGVVLDWNAYIPPPVPDDQNFFKAPKMTEWFVKLVNPPVTPVTNELTRDLDYGKLTPEHQSQRIPVMVAELLIVPGATNASESDAILRFDDPAARGYAKELIQRATGPSASGAQGFYFVAKPLSQIQPAHIVLQTDKLPDLKEVASLFPADTVSTNVGNLRVQPGAGANSFRILLVPRPVYSADEFLQWSDQAAQDFDLIREALKRPYARMDGDYSKPYEQPIPNFIAVRMIAQTLASRAQCYLLLGQPDKALQELTLMHDMRRLLEAAPTGKPMTLVTAMINVAVTGLYVDALAEGFRLHAWQEPQMAALQEQLKEINLPPILAVSFKTEQVAQLHIYTHTNETTQAAHFFADLSGLYEVADLVLDDASASGKAKAGAMSRLLKYPTSLLLKFAPRGWWYQNVVYCVVIGSKSSDGFDLEHDTIAPRVFDGAARNLKQSQDHKSPFKLLAAIILPNTAKATQTTAHNQTMVNEAQIVCALERYRLANGEYPGTLDALSPQFIEKLPHDIIGGEPLIYRRTADGTFLLYSIGWNEKDDGGQQVTAQTKNGGTDFTKGDWVWKN
jgi:hypothetical protein